MSLTVSDLQEIRKIIKEEISPLDGELKAARNDIKDIYDMIADLQKSLMSIATFEKLSLEKKILQLHAPLVQAAKQAGVTLPH